MIERDGYSPSLWQATAKPYVSLNKPGNKPYDVIIVGGGITGVTTALQLQEAGKQCLLLEARNLCFGTTGGTTAHINTLLDTPYYSIEKNFGTGAARSVADAAAAAVQLIRHNIQKYSINCTFTEAAAYLFAQTERQEKELTEIADAAIAAGLDVQHETSIPLHIHCTKAVKVGGQAKFNPVDYVYGLAKAYENLGGVILQDCRVSGVQKKELVEVVTGQGSFSASDLIYATHIPPGVNLLHLRCAPYRTYAMAVILENEILPQDLFYDMEDPYHYYRAQKMGCADYLIAGGKDHKTGQEENTAYLFTELEATIRRNFEVKEIVQKWSSQYFEPADGIPYIGHLPGHPENIYTATGFGGNGITYSQIAATVLTSIILKTDNPLIKLFNPNRIKPVAGFTNFITHNADVVGNLVSRIFPHSTLDVLAALAPGEAKIVKYEGEKLGLYKDEQGKLHAVNPVCTHLKCEVRWNDAERSWDCPCHGARFDCNGSVITGPADRSLEKIEIPLHENKPQV